MPGDASGIRRYRQARVHENAAKRMTTKAAMLIPAAVDAFCDANRLWPSGDMRRRRIRLRLAEAAPSQHWQQSGHASRQCVENHSPLWPTPTDVATAQSQPLRYDLTVIHCTTIHIGRSVYL